MSEPDLSRLLSPEGPLGKVLPGMEERSSQVEMALAVDEVLTGSGRLIVEAGPGTGKTFAYLIPALLRADPPTRRIVISTWTRTLQEQIQTKDLPLLESAFHPETEVAFLQGRANYLCLRRAEEAIREPRGEASLRQLRSILEWGRRSSDGTRSTLGFEPLEEVWSASRAEHGNCLQARSPFFRQCGWQWARRHARQAGVLVVNHALLLSDVKLRRTGATLLPPHDCLIIDEAHHLESQAAQHLGIRLGLRQVVGLLARVGREEGGRLHQEVAALARDARELFLEYLDRVDRWMSGRSTARFEFNVQPDPALLPVLDRLMEQLERKAREVEGEARRLEWNVRAAMLENFRQEWLVFQDNVEPDSLSYVERIGAEGPIVLCRSPIEPGKMLEKELFTPLTSVVLTSATLSVPSRSDPFEFIRQASGLQNARAVSLASPFDYASQAQIVVDPLPDPSAGPQQYNQALIDRIPLHLQRSAGRAFVLFTSRKTMQAVVAGLKNTLESDGVEVLVQGGGMPRSDLIKRFRMFQPAVLFGLASFWEGVDVAGEELSQVILTRLPFRVPGHPVDEERGRKLKAAGGDPFRDRSLPEAVLRFKQGFGRLIRSTSDRGTVTILDSRIKNRSYGAVFLESLPECPWILMRGDEEVPVERSL